MVKKAFMAIPILLIAILVSLATPAHAYADDSSYQPRMTSPSSSISYYSSQKNVYFQTGYGMPNCVAYAYGRIYEMNGEKPKIDHGSAGDWYAINKANGYYEYGQTPKLGAVACWSNHVAIVEKIDGNAITISESHWGGTYFDTKTYTNMNSHYGQTFYGYIYTYNEGMTEEFENQLVNAKKEKNTQYKQEKKTELTTNKSFNIIKLDSKITIPKKETLLDKIR